MFTFSTYRRCLALGALVLACCALLAPAASAMIPDRHHGTTQAAAYGALYQFPNVGIVADGQLSPGDVGYYTRDVGATASDAGLIADGTIGRPAPADGIVATEGAPVVPAAGTGFDWNDAGVGIVLGVLCAMLLVGLLVLSRRRGTLSGA